MTLLSPFAGVNHGRMLKSIQKGLREGKVNNVLQTLAAYAFLAPPGLFQDGCLLSMCRCLLKIETMHGGEPFHMVIDTGATVNLVKQ